MFDTNDLLRSIFKNSETPIETNIVGDVPKWLCGTLFRYNRLKCLNFKRMSLKFEKIKRNGPGRFEYGDKKYRHLFDGQACVHKFKIENGKVYYSNRFLETRSYLKTLRDSRLYQVFGTADMDSSFFGRVKTLFVPPETFDNVNISVMQYSNKALYALTETNFLLLLNPKDLSILNRIDLTAHIPSATTTNSHPHIDEDGSWIIASLNVQKRLSRPRYEFIKYEAAKNEEELNNLCLSGKVMCSIPSSHRLGLCYFHSFGITENYIIFLEQALKLSFPRLVMTALFNTAFSNCMKSIKDWPTKIHVVDRVTWKLVEQKYVTQPLVCFHHINAYETIDSNKNVEIICDLIGYNPSTFDINLFTSLDMYSDKYHEAEFLRSTVRRLRIPVYLNKPQSKDPIFCELVELNPKVIFEMPCINYTRINGRPYKYCYGTNYFRKPFSIIKINVENPTEVYEKKYIQDGKSFLPSEPVFVEKPDAESEDDGIILVMVLADQHDYLSILDAKNLNELAKAEIGDDVKAAFTFHGFFASAYSACSKIHEEA